MHSEESPKSITKEERRSAGVRRESSSSGAHLFLALECDHPTEQPARYRITQADLVVIGRDARRGISQRIVGDERVLFLGVPDQWMSATHARLRRTSGTWLLEDANSRNGTFVNGAPISSHSLDDGELFEAGHTLFLFRSDLPGTATGAALDGRDLRPAAPGLATLLPALQERFQALETIAASTVPVMIKGESGTGKELAAAALHQLSARLGRLVPVNCGALPATLMESELFGYRKGAFSGASEDRTGLVRSADGGTLFLDEIGDLPLAGQAALLRVLQECEVLPLGATKAVPADFRLVAATHRNLDEMSTSGAFRRDLLARLSGFAIELPALRDRREDLGILIAALLERTRGKEVSLSNEAARALFDYDWPLNIRELQQALSTAVVLAKNGLIALKHLPASLGASAIALEELSEIERARRNEIVALLGEFKGNVAAVARALGKARPLVHRWVKRYGIDPNSYRV